MYEHILKEDRIAVLWLGELLPDLDAMPDRFKEHFQIERTNRLDIALQMMAELSYDIVVIHLRNNDFALRYQWLRNCVKEHPGTIRVMLNDKLPAYLVAKASELCHRSIAFTASVDDMLHEISQCLQVKQLISKPVIKEYVGAVEHLPSIPSVYMTLNEALANDATGAADIAKIIEQDPAMSAKLLQLVNSAFFSLNSHVFKIKDAVVILGVRQIRDLFLVSRLFEHYPQNSFWNAFSFENLRNRDMVVGRFARAICRDLKVAPDIADKAFLAALLQDIGVLVFATRDPDSYRSVMQQAALMGQPLYALEKLRLGVTHMEVGAYMLRLWNLPPEVVDAVLFHSFPNATNSSKFTPLSALHIADSLLPDVVNLTDCRTNSRINAKYIQRLGLEKKIPEWQQMAQGYADQLYAGVGEGY
ncbi:MAG: HDOD domain-containing protein [Amphritea sp.]